MLLRLTQHPDHVSQTAETKMKITTKISQTENHSPIKISRMITDALKMYLTYTVTVTG